MFGFFKKTEVQLSPPVKGRITDAGKPLSGVEVVRELFYSGYDKENAIIDYALTNTNGEFSFDEKIIKSRSPNDIFGQDFLISQEVYIKKDISIRKDEEDKYYWLWLTNKSWPSIPKLNDLMLQLNADLQNKEVQHDMDLSQYGGLPNQVVLSICYLQKI